MYREPGGLQVEDVPVPEIGPGELLVRMEACGVCGTDVKKIMKGLYPGPRIFGHEICGVVARVGSGVTRFREGQRVALHHHVPCRVCFYCREGAFAQCSAYKRNGTTAGFEPAGGGMAEYIRAMDWIVAHGTIRVPDGVLPEEAAFIEPVNTCLKAVRQAKVGPGQSVLVVGQGPIGLLFTQLACWHGAEVVASDPMSERRALSQELGAATTLDPAAQDVPCRVRELTGGRGADRVLLAALGGDAFAQAVAAARPGGSIMVFAATSPGETAQVDLGALCVAEKQILTSYSASHDVQDLAAQLVLQREIRVRELVSHRLPLERADEAIRLSNRPTPGVLKVVVEASRDARSAEVPV